MPKTILLLINHIFHKTLILLIFLLSVFYSYSQDCNCEKEFLFIRDFIETNYAGFHDKVNAETIDGYKEFTAEVLHNIRKHDDTGSCIYWIGEWLGFFRDGHIQYGGYFNLGDLDDEARKSHINQMETIVK